MTQLRLFGQKFLAQLISEYYQLIYSEIEMPAWTVNKEYQLMKFTVFYVDLTFYHSEDSEINIAEQKIEIIQKTEELIWKQERETCGQ